MKHRTQQDPGRAGGKRVNPKAQDQQRERDRTGITDPLARRQRLPATGDAGPLPDDAGKPRR